MRPYRGMRQAILFITGLLMVFLATLLLPADTKMPPKQVNYSLSALTDKTILITSAGQSTDTYILQDIANELRLHNLFMPQAVAIDAESTHALIVVAGYSEVGLKLHKKTYKEELERVALLVKEAKDAKVPIITIFLGGKERRGQKTDALIQSLIPKSDYVITTYAGDHDQLLSRVAGQYGVPISIINEALDMTEPLASVFR